jgi:hypothetical protein
MYIYIYRERERECVCVCVFGCVFGRVLHASYSQSARVWGLGFRVEGLGF